MDGDEASSCGVSSRRGDKTDSSWSTLDDRKRERERGRTFRNNSLSLLGSHESVRGVRG